MLSIILGPTKVEMTSIALKIRGGTARGDEPSLCRSCDNATIIRGRSLDEELIHCHELGAGRGGSPSDHTLIRFHVTSCTGYQPFGQPSLWNMEKTAWVLRTDERSRKIGFVPAAELKDDEKHEY